jgi:hypothetical protein
MRGGLRWPYRPFQVTCVLVAVLLAAAFSLALSLAEYAEDQPNLSTLNREGLGERLNAKTIAIIFGNPKAISLKTASLTVACALSDAAAAGRHCRTLPLVDKDDVSRRVSGGATRRAGERGKARSIVPGLRQTAGV